jgi:hypothetical protein
LRFLRNKKIPANSGRGISGYGLFLTAALSTELLPLALQTGFEPATVGLNEKYPLPAPPAKLVTASCVCAYKSIPVAGEWSKRVRNLYRAVPSPSRLRLRPVRRVFRQGFRPARSFGGSNSPLSPPAPDNLNQLIDKAPPWLRDVLIAERDSGISLLSQPRGNQRRQHWRFQVEVSVFFATRVLSIL